MKTLSTREAVIQALTKLARQDKRIVIVSPDSMLAARAASFAEEFPDQFIEVGIAEQNAVDVAAGLATTGMKPVVITYAGFLTMRACEMIRTFIAYPSLDVKLIGLNGGMLGGEREGVTHQFYEDLGILRSMPGVKIVTPADAHQAYNAVNVMFELSGPVYLRLANGREPEIFDKDVPFVFGKIDLIKQYGNDVAIFASGYIMNRAIEAIEKLHRDGIQASLFNVSTLKPLDFEYVSTVLHKIGAAVTVEDHNIYGALGSAICEVACMTTPCPVIRIGLQDVYARSGYSSELLDMYNIRVTDICEGALKAIKIKRENV